MKEYNFKASDNNGEMLVGLGFSFSFMGVAGLILMLRLVLFPKIKYSSYVNNIYLEKFLIVVPALIITAYVMKLIKICNKNYHIYEDKEILKIENDKKIIELAYTAIKDVKFNKKEIIFLSVISLS